MKAQELRIGNYIQDKQGEIDQVYELLVIEDLKEKINDDPYEGYFQPIPLTEEWLVKLGFDKRIVFDGDWFDVSSVQVNDDDENPVFGFKFSMNNERLKVVEHVHQLQNLYFALTGEELTIKNTEG